MDLIFIYLSIGADLISFPNKKNIILVVLQETPGHNHVILHLREVIHHSYQLRGHINHNLLVILGDSGNFCADMQLFYHMVDDLDRDFIKM